MEESSHALKKPMLGDRSYQTLKRSATVVLPGVGALYFTLAQIWHLPHAEEVVGSIAAVNTFIGVILGVSTSSYNKSHSSTGVEYAGVVEVEERPDKKVLKFNLNENAQPIEDQDEVVFKVGNSDTGSNRIVEP